MKKYLLILGLFLNFGILSAQCVPASTDTDGDGICDLVDIDDDNDGVLDAVESPACFYQASEANKTVKVSSPLSGFTGNPAVALAAGNDIPSLRDGDTSDAIFRFAASQSIPLGSSIFTMEYPVAVALKDLTVRQAVAGMISDASVPKYGVLDGSLDGGAYTLGISNVVRISNVTTVTFTLNSTTPYKFYRIRYFGTSPTAGTGPAGVTIGTSAQPVREISSTLSTTVPYISSAHPKPGPCTMDTDGDTIPNHLDSDSDGDGCPDAYEAGATNNSSTSAIAGPYGTNGLADSLETGADNGQINYTSTYNRFAIYKTISLCVDSDGDGVPDPLDIDDDNDGIIDADESPECFYNIFEANKIVKISSPLDGNTGSPAVLLPAENNIPTLHDADFVDGSFRFLPEQTIPSGSSIFTMEYPIAIVLKSLTVTQSSAGMISDAGVPKYGVLDGSNDGVAYTNAISNVVRISGVTNVVFTLSSTTPYKYYRIRYIGTSTSGNTTSGETVGTTTNPVHEIHSLLSTTIPYIPSLQPKPGPCGTDIDGDLIPSHLDSDSDGDGCSDAYEAGATAVKTVSVIAGPYGANGLANSLETTADSGVYNYVSTYGKYAIYENLNLCIDTDNDGVPNPKDLDDDNDGVLDTDEGDFCGKINRTIKVGYVNSANGTNGLNRDLLLNLRNFGLQGTYNKVRGVTLVPFPTAASITEASLLAQGIDIFFVGSQSGDANNNPSSTLKVLTSINTVLKNWAINNDKGIIALQNNAVDYGYLTRDNNVNNDVPYGIYGTDAYTNGYWPVNTLNQTGGVQMTIMSNTNTFNILMVDANLRPAVVADTEYNLLIIPDAGVFEEGAAAERFNPVLDIDKVAADSWALVFDRYLNSICTSVDTDGDGTPNHLDLDSDGDGCSDATESGAIGTLSPDFQFPNVDTNGDGLVDAVDAGNDGATDYLSYYDIKALDDTLNDCGDPDGDGVVNKVDLDDDNDGILDVAEGQICNEPFGPLRIGYVNTAVGRNGLMMNMLSNPVNFSYTGTYTKFQSIVFVPYANEAAVTEAVLLADNVDIFFVGSDNEDGQVTGTNKLSPALNNRLYSWSVTHDKGLIVLQNNAWDYGYTLQNEYPNSNPTTSYGPVGYSVYENGYWPTNEFEMTGVVTMSINSAIKNFEAIRVDKRGKSVFIRDKKDKLVFFPDGTVFSDNQTVATIGTSTSTQDKAMRAAADTWAYAFDTFITGRCNGQDTDGDGIPDHLDLDSDNDGCPDAIEGGATITPDQLVTAGGTLKGGNGVNPAVTPTLGEYNQEVLLNLCEDGTCVNATGIPQFATLPADYTNAGGQSVGISTTVNPFKAGTASASQTITTGTAPAALAITGHEGASIRWQVSTDNITFTDIAGATGAAATYAPGALTATTYYRVVVTSAGGCTLTSNVVTIIVKCTISATNPDSDGDGIADDCDLDDDNDGILDTAECNNTINAMLGVYPTGLLDILPSDFGLNPGDRNQNVTADLSDKFGYPINSGAVIISITNASVEDVTNFWWIKAGETPSIWNVTGTMSSFVLMSQNDEFYGNDSKTIHIYDNATVIPITVGPLTNQTAVPGEWGITETSSEKVFSRLVPTHSSYAIDGEGNWRYANMNFGAKSFGFSTTTSVASPTYAVNIFLECDTDKDGIPDRLDLDSDNDGCLDAIEGGANIATSQLVNAQGTVTSGFGSPTFGVPGAEQNLGNVIDANGVPTVVGSGQTVGDSQNATINGCTITTCNEPPTDLSSIKPVNHGITLLGRAGTDNGNWPMGRNSAYTALESKTKGFVITRMADPQTAIATPVVGMMVFDTDENAGKGCLKIYTGSAPTEGWKCFEVATCP